jgi:hypothetical protein
MIDVRYPKRRARAYNIHWVNNWVDRVDGLAECEFIVLDVTDERLYNIVASKDAFELVILVNSDHEVLKVRSLSPCVYTVSHEVVEVSPEEIKREAQEVLAQAKIDLGVIGMIQASWEES